MKNRNFIGAKKTSELNYSDLLKSIKAINVSRYDDEDYLISTNLEGYNYDDRR